MRIRNTEILGAPPKGIALLDLKTYHLPPYFNVPIAVKRRLPTVTEQELPSTSVKFSFLASLLGCARCGETEPFHWQPSTWNKLGCCPSCEPLPRCQHTQAPYGLWGLCEDCYLDWQQSYYDLGTLNRLITKYGQVAPLLISPDVAWLEYIMQYNKMGRYAPKRLKSFKLLNDIDINIKELLNAD